jgi:hypothetical protein
MPHQSVTLPFKALALLSWTALIGAIHVAPVRAAAIRAIMLETWDKPDARLMVDPVVVLEGFALASWTQGKRGGRALLRKEAGKWKVVLCSGEPLRHAVTLAATGLPAGAAGQLAHLLNQAESKLPADHVALFSTFEGVVHMDGQHGHGH